MENLNSKYTKTYTTFGGADIVATFGSKVIGSLQALTYSVSRETAPVYSLGSAEPRSFSRGKRGIGGTLVFTVFDRDALIDAMKEEEVRRIGAVTSTVNTFTDPLSIDQWDEIMTGKVSGKTPQETASSITERGKVFYADELPPFDITISFANEFGQQSVLVIYGVQIINEGTGFSVDSIVTEKACTFVARRVEPMKAVNSDGTIVE